MEGEREKEREDSTWKNRDRVCDSLLKRGDFYRKGTKGEPSQLSNVFQTLDS